MLVLVLFLLSLSLGASVGTVGTVAAIPVALAFSVTAVANVGTVAAILVALCDCLASSRRTAQQTLTLTLIVLLLAGEQHGRITGWRPQLRPSPSQES